MNAVFGSFKVINVLPKEKTREQKEAELIPKMQEAVNYGLRVLESAFEHLDIKAGNSDSEDEEVPDKVEAILEPKVRSQTYSRVVVLTAEMYMTLHLCFLSCLSGSLRGQTTSVSDWFSSFHGTRRCWTWRPLK